MMKPGKIIQTANAFLKAKLLNKKAPLVVGWAITDKCNRKCACCDIWQGPVRDLPTTRVFEIVDTLARMGALRISFTGGEPLLRKDMGKIIDYVHEKGIETKLNTNGALVKRKIKHLKNLDMMNLSLEGPEEIHDAIRGKGSFNEVMEAVRTAKAHNIKFNFASVLTRINLDAVDYILDKARQKNCKVVFQPATRITLGSQRPNNLVSRENEYREVIKKLIKIKKSGDKAIGNSVQGLAHLSKWPRPENIKCASGWVSCRIASDGNVMHCSRESMAFTPANCTDVGFREAFDRLGPVSCDDCWCAARVELNLMFSLRFPVILNQLKSLAR